MDTPTAVRDGGWTARLVLSTIFLAMVLEAMSLGAAMVSIGLPSILAEFPTDQGGWLVTTYFLAGAIAAPLFGRSADLYGKRRLLLIAMAIATVGCVICALAPNFLVLVIGRALQGALMATISLTYSLIRDVYPPRPAAFAASITITGIGVFSMVSPLLIGWLIATFGFRGMFWFDGIWTFTLCIAIWLTIPESTLRRRARPDALGGVLLAFGVLSVLLYVSTGRTWGWTSVLGLSVVGLGVVLLGLFVRHTRRVDEPIVNLGLFTRKPLIFVTVFGGVGYALAGTIGQVVPLLAMTPREAGGTYGLGLTTVQYAAIATPSALAGVIGGIVLGTMVAKGTPPRVFMLIGMTSWLVGMLLLAFRNDTLPALVLGAVVYGLGSGTVQAAVPTLVIRATPRSDQGATAGAVQLVQTGFGSVLPVVMFAVLAPFATMTPAGGVIYAEAGFRTWLLIASGLALLVLLIGMTVLREKRVRGGAAGGSATATAMGPESTGTVPLPTAVDPAAAPGVTPKS